MNLLFHSPTFYPLRGGAEFLFEDMTAILAEQGHRVIVLTEADEVRTETPHVSGPEVHRGAHVFRVRYPRASRSLRSLLRFGRGVRQLSRWHRRLVTRESIDAVCVARIDQECGYVTALSRSMGVRLSVYLHGAEMRYLQRDYPQFRRALRAVLRAADSVVAVSPDLEREVIRFAPRTAAKVQVLRNGVDVEAIARTRPASAARPYALFVGRLEPVKDPALLIEAFDRVVRQTEDLDLVLAGAGSMERQLTDRIEELGCTARVRLVGSIERERAHALMRGAVCLVLPSLAEGNPLVVLEAWAAGTPVLGSDAKGLRDLIEDGVNGRLFPRGDADRLAALLVHTADGGHEPLRAGVAAMDLDRFDIRARIDRHLRIIAG